MTLQDIMDDIHAMTRLTTTYERKYGILSETFYKAYSAGHEPADDAWVLDWAEWAGAYQVLLRRREEYRRAIEDEEKGTQTLGELLAKAARHEPIPVAA